MARSRTRQSDEPSSGVLHEVEAIVCMAIGTALALSFASYSPGAPTANYVGPAGYAVANVLIQCFGYAAYIFPVLLLLAALTLFVHLSAPVSPIRVVGGFAALFEAALALGLYRQGVPAEQAGGWVGGFLATLMQGVFGLVGSTLILIASGLLVFIMLTGQAPSELAARGFAVLVEKVQELAAALREQARGGFARLRARLPRPRLPRFARVRAGRSEPPAELAVVFGGDVDKTDTIEVGTDAAEPIVKISRQAGEAKSKRGGRTGKNEDQAEFVFDVDDSDYKLPPVHLLGAHDEKQDMASERQLITQSKILEQKLATFGVSGRVTAVRPGPVITTYEFEPDAGIKVSRVVNLCDDLTMAMRAHGVRIVAPIPGKNVVGIEVSNKARQIVGLRDLIGAPEFSKHGSKLTLALGRDTTGNPVYADLTRMPHLLMAGATGSGKSVALNSVILSILYRCSPRDVRFIMIDPKMLELSIYEGIQHLLVPVVTDVKKAASALANVMREMDRRFELMKDLGVRNIDDYNQRILELPDDEDEDEDEAYEIGDETDELVEGEDDEAIEDDEEGDEENDEEIEDDEEEDEDDEDDEDDVHEEEGLLHEHLPRILVIVDELADLMMTVGREVEDSITRLAQKARAAGIHLILATQRPSVDVITGLIKANFPSRISFQVTSRPDSRTILDSIGAERLLGNGDMLYLAPGTSFIQRLHGAYVSDREARAVGGFVKKQGDPDYRMDLLETPGGEEGDADDEEFFDELYDRAVDLVTEHGQGSTSWLQRKLSIGYNRAARIMEHMEREGVVGPADGSRPRKVIAQAIPR